MHAGDVSPAVTQADLKQTICRKGGYTRGTRPPAAVTDREKKLNAASYGYKGRLGDAEYDHLVSLELGGDPNDPRNLWVEERCASERSGMRFPPRLKPGIPTQDQGRRRSSAR